MICDVITRGDLESYVLGELPAKAGRRVEAHLFTCAECAAELRLLRAERRLFRARAEADAAEVPAFEGVLARIEGESVALPAASGDRASLPLPAARSGVAAKGRARRVMGSALGVLAAAAAIGWLWVGGRAAPQEPAAGSAAFPEIVSEEVCLRDSPEHEVEAERVATFEASPSEEREPWSPMSGAVAWAPENTSACASGAHASEGCSGAEALMSSACEDAVAWCSVGRP
jgi:anti-sigma factor RsiW